jgi:4-amino-4-deoxy-L-arabinose transferase-like glycosyltransferase
MKIKPKHLIGIAVFVISFATLLMTVSDYGLTWDEPYYIAHSNRLQQWFGLLFNHEAAFSEESVNSLVQFDRYHNCHPPFYKLSALLFKNLLGNYFYTNPLYQYRISTMFWSALLIAILYFYLFRAYRSHLIAVFGAGLFFTVPRFFSHMHLFATDTIIVSLYFLALYLFIFGSKKMSAISSGIFAGALLASKFTGVLLLPTLLMVAPCFRDRNEYARRFLLFLPAAALAFIFFDIHFWVGFRRELLFYFNSVLDRESIAAIQTLFFGKLYDFRLPWYQPLVMLGICLPALLIAFCVLSPAYGRFARDRKLWLFEILPFVFLILMFALPRTPKHDGIRQFSLAWPFLVLLSIRGICGISAILNRRVITRIVPPGSAVAAQKGLVTVLFSIALLTNIWALVRYHPYQLSFYNAAIGGPSGAAEKGFTISYWYDALDQNFLQQLNALAKNDPALVYSYPNADILEFNRVLGLVNPDIQSTGNPKEADYLLILNRIIGGRMSGFLKGKETALKASTPDDVWLLSLFVNKQKQQPQSASLQNSARHE